MIDASPCPFSFNSSTKLYFSAAFSCTLGGGTILHPQKQLILVVVFSKTSRISFLISYPHGRMMGEITQVSKLKRIIFDAFSFYFGVVVDNSREMVGVVILHSSNAVFMSNINRTSISTATLHTSHSQIPHLASYILHLTSYTLHPTPYILHLKSQVSHLTSHIPHLTPDEAQTTEQYSVMPGPDSELVKRNVSWKKFPSATFEIKPSTQPSIPHSSAMHPLNQNIEIQKEAHTVA